MAGNSEKEAIKMIENDVQEINTEILNANQAIKAQKEMVKIYKRGEEQCKERCSFLAAANLNKKSEIDTAQMNIESMRIAYDVIKQNKVELKQKLLITETQLQDMTERLNTSEKKHDKRWLEVKARYESLPYVQEYLKANEELENIKQQISDLDNENNLIQEKIKAKTENCREIERKRIVEFAEFTVKDRPKYTKSIKEKTAGLEKIQAELSSLKPKIDGVPSTSVNIDTLSMFPKNHDYIDCDDIYENLEKIKRNDSLTKKPEKAYCVHSVIFIDPSKRRKRNNPITEESFSSFFYQPYGEQIETQDFAKKKLINILSDINIDKREAKRMLADANPAALQPIDSIFVDKHQGTEKNENNTGDMETEDIEEIDLTSRTEPIILPPTQFLDMTPDVQADYSQKVSQKEQPAEVSNQLSTSNTKVKNILKATPTTNSQDEPPKKKVCFDLSDNMETLTVNEPGKPDNGEVNTNETENSQLNACKAEDGFDQIKDMIMKKHNLDLSPQFVYAKNVKTPLNVQKPEDEIVTSKFFPQTPDQNNAQGEPEVFGNIAVEEIQTGAAAAVVATPIDNEPEKLTQNNLSLEELPNSKQYKVNLNQVENLISGSTFSQFPEMTPDYLNSSNATVTEDGHNYSSYIDSNLLLSPNAVDLSTPNVMDTEEVLTPDVPNFLAGLRNTGRSLLEQMSYKAESKPDSNAQNETQGASGFNFNFDGKEKKNRGGIFSMFQ